MLRALLAALLVVALAACGEDGGPTEPQIPQIGGVWNQTNSFSNASVGISCASSGALNITQSGQTFSGTFQQTRRCTDSFGNLVDFNDAGNLSGGQLSGSGVTFQTGFCSWQGTVSGSPPNRMNGSISCQIDAGGQTFTFTGTWQASR